MAQQKKSDLCVVRFIALNFSGLMRLFVNARLSHVLSFQYVDKIMKSCSHREIMKCRHNRSYGAYGST